MIAAKRHKNHKKDFLSYFFVNLVPFCGNSFSAFAYLAITSEITTRNNRYH